MADTLPLPCIDFLMFLRHHDFALKNVHLRNLLTHTVNNLLQTLNNVKSIQFFAVKQKFNIIHIMCENFKTILRAFCKLQLI